MKWSEGEDPRWRRQGCELVQFEHNLRHHYYIHSIIATPDIIRRRRSLHFTLTLLPHLPSPCQAHAFDFRWCHWLLVSRRIRRWSQIDTLTDVELRWRQQSLQNRKSTRQWGMRFESWVDVLQRPGVSEDGH